MVVKIDTEVLTVFCRQCKCCLATTTHCGTCHTRKAIKTLCGCGGTCEQKAQDYVEREQARIARMEALRKARVLYGGIE